MKLLEATLEGIMVERPDPSPEEPQHLCADKGYDYSSSRQEVAAHHYIPHIRSRWEEGQEKLANPERQARRWVVDLR